LDLPVALDAMGGDHAPDEIVKGAEEAAREGVPVVLVGPEERVRACEAFTGAVPVVDAPEVIGMAEDPAMAIRTKRNSSLVRCAELVTSGLAGAMVSAGNTGATMAAALFKVGRIKNVSRPGIASLLPIPDEDPVVLIDSGAQAECRPEWLVQFAQMGAIFWSLRVGGRTPRVGLLSIGEEEGKGNELTKKAFPELKAASGEVFEFVGNVEGRDILARKADVVVTDGFTGNVALKTMEGTFEFFVRLLLSVFSGSEEAKEVGRKVLELIAPVAEQVHPDTTGGALLLGVKGVCVISHGRSGARAIKNAVRLAHSMEKDHLVAKIAERFR
jgi:glycerol-3-phosphate acyltransferase PlsX